jgi:UDP-N-acetylmuramyl pentapeptide phosphotransferase/UDP-N-acetylglucosamine-1-phosphate transferase
MESSTARTGVDLAADRTYPLLALVLAILSVPGSTLAWDLFDGAGFVIGMPLAIAAIVLGVQARRRSQKGRGQATAAIVIAAAMVALTVVWTIASAL